MLQPAYVIIERSSQFVGAAVDSLVHTFGFLKICYVEIVKEKNVTILGWIFVLRIIVVMELYWYLDLKNLYR